MTSFAWPLRVRGADTNVADYEFQGRVVVAAEATISLGNIANQAAGVTIIPLKQPNGQPLVVPAGAKVLNSFIDVLTPWAPVSGTNINIGYGTARNQIFAQTSIETAGIRTYTPTTAQISLNRVPFALPTTIEAMICVSGSNVPTAGELIILIEVF